MYKIVFNGLACWNYSSTLVTVRVKVFETLCLWMPTCHFCSLAEHIPFLFKWLSRLKQLESVSIAGLCDVIKTCNRRRRLHWSGPVLPAWSHTDQQWTLGTKEHQQAATGSLTYACGDSFYNKIHKLSCICLADVDPEENVQIKD